MGLHIGRVELDRLVRTHSWPCAPTKLPTTDWTADGFLAVLAAEPEVIHGVVRTGADGPLAILYGVVPLLDGVIGAREQVERGCVTSAGKSADGLVDASGGKHLFNGGVGR